MMLRTLLAFDGGVEFAAREAQRNILAERDLVS